jgi:hypothetical protein
MPRFDYANAWVRAAIEHVATTGHEIIPADNPMARTLGFACLDCESDSNTIWDLTLQGVRALPQDSPLRRALSTAEGKVTLTRAINTNARNPSGIDMAWTPSAPNPNQPVEQEIETLEALWGGVEELDRQARERHQEEMRIAEEATRKTRFDRTLDED